VACGTPSWSPLPFAQRAVLAHEQLVVRALFVRELEKHLLTLGILEAFAVALEELVRSALAPDADQQRLLVVHSFGQLFGSGGEQAAGGAFEEEKGWARFELRIARGERRVALLQRAEVLALLGGELPEHRATAAIRGERGGARIELEAAALGRDRHAQGVAREHAVGGRAVNRRRFPAGAALLAGADNLHHRLRRREISRRGDLFHQRLDIRAQKLRRTMAGRANEMKMPRVAKRRLETRSPFAEIDFPRDAGADHPLQGAVDGRAADARVFAADVFEQVVGTEVPLLTEEHAHDPIAFGGVLTAGWDGRNW